MNFMATPSIGRPCLALFACLMLSCGCSDNLTVRLSNPLDIDRNDEMIEIPSDVLKAEGFGDMTEIIVMNSGNEEVPSQITHEGSLIFQADVPAGGRARYTVKAGAPSEYPTRAYGRFVPERKDDICWENDRIAFRTYGPALEATGEITCGYDVWVKRTEDMVIDRRYDLELNPETMKKRTELLASGDKEAYDELIKKISFHIDHGDGLDYYAVGRTLGAGAMAPYTDGKLWMANNFVSYEVLDNGPLRFTCRLDYAPFEVNGRTVTEHRTISMDAGSQFNHALVRYCEDGRSAEGITAAAGIILHGTNDYLMNPEEGYMYYADPASTSDGQTYLAVMFDEGPWSTKVDCNHLLAVTQQTSEEGISYHFGAGWSRFGFRTPADWGEHVKAEALKLRNPIIVSY